MAKIKICLDAGHYGKYNRSNVVPGYYESEMNWKLHNLLKKYLEQYGIEVIQTRSDQTKDMGTITRGKKAVGCNLFLSIHSNACGTESVDYPLVIVPLDGSGDAIGNKLAKCIEETMDTKQKCDVWTKKSDNGNEWYGVIRGAVAVGVPGLILEHSFHTNTRAANWLSIDSNLDKLARAEADVIAAHYGLKKTVAPATPVTPVKKSVDQIAQEVINGDWGNGQERKDRLTAAGYNYSEIQKLVNKLANGETSPAPAKKSIEEIAKEVCNGDWGNGAERKQKLTAAGYDYNTIQKKVNELVSGKTASAPAPKKTVSEIAREVINGDWGNGTDRKNRLTAAGYNYSAVQKEVNRILKG